MEYEVCFFEILLSGAVGKGVVGECILGPCSTVLSLLLLPDVSVSGDLSLSD